MRKSSFAFVLVFALFSLTACGNLGSSSGSNLSGGDTSASSLDPALVITDEIDQAAGHCVENPCPINVTIGNTSSAPDTIYGIIQFQTDDGTWYDDMDRAQQVQTTVDLTLNPRMQRTIYGSQGSYVGAPSGTHFVKVRLFNNATDSGDGIEAIGDADFTLP